MAQRRSINDPFRRVAWMGPYKSDLQDDLKNPEAHSDANEFDAEHFGGLPRNQCECGDEEYLCQLKDRFSGAPSQAREA